MENHLHVRIPASLHHFIKSRAGNSDTTMTEWVQDAITRKIRQELNTNNHPDITFIDLFAGIGGLRLGIEKAAANLDIAAKCLFSSEWDRFCQQTYEENFGERPAGDITKIDPRDVPYHDLLVAGFPCQPFSLAGVSKKRSLGRATGFRDREQGHLFFSIIDILQEKGPKAVLLENVKHLLSHDGGRTFAIVQDLLRSEGYAVFYDVIDAADYVPQHRERVFIVGLRTSIFGKDIQFSFPDPPEDRRAALEDILERQVPDRYTLSDNLWEYLQEYAERHRRRGNGFGYGMADLGGITRTLSARYYKDGSEILIPQQDNNPRRLTPREAARLMGFDDSFVIPVSDTQAYRQFGNSVVVPVVAAIAEKLLPILSMTTVARASN